MANPDAVTKLYADLAALVAQVNNLTASVRLICEMIDADNGTIGTDYVASVTDAGVATAPATLSPVYG